MKPRANPAAPRDVAKSCGRPCARAQRKRRFCTKPKFDSEPSALAGSDRARQHLLQSGCFEPAVHFFVPEAQTAMREFAATEFEFVRSEVHDQHTSPRPQHARCFRHRGLRVVQVMQHLMENCEIKSLYGGARGKWQTLNVGEPDLTVARANTFETIARNCQPVRANVHAG